MNVVNITKILGSTCGNKIKASSISYDTLKEDDMCKKILKKARDVIEKHIDYF